MIGVHYYSKVSLHIYVNDYVNIFTCTYNIHIHIHIIFLHVTCILIINIVHVLLYLTPPLKFEKKKTKKTLAYSGYLEYVVNTCDSWFLVKGASPREEPNISYK